MRTLMLVVQMSRTVRGTDGVHGRTPTERPYPGEGG